MATKVREHNEYFRTVSLSKRKSCQNCGEKLPPNEQIWSWGEYQNGKWYTVQYFCINCWDKGYHNPKERLIEHRRPCGCIFNLKGKSGRNLPHWLTLD